MNIVDARIITEEERKIMKGNISAYSKSLVETNIEAVLDVLEDTMELDTTDNSYLPDRFKD